jgi:EAL domain-containing protein (putative c-di-GMP-specific phosphodiesterase class I)
MKDLGVAVIQGYHTGRPMAAESFMNGYHHSGATRQTA